MLNPHTAFKASSIIRLFLINMLNQALQKQGLSDMVVTHLSSDFQHAVVLYRGQTVALPAVTILPVVHSNAN